MSITSDDSLFVRGEGEGVDGILAGKAAVTTRRVIIIHN